MHLYTLLFVHEVPHCFKTFNNLGVYINLLLVLMLLILCLVKSKHPMNTVKPNLYVVSESLSGKIGT